MQGLITNCPRELSDLANTAQYLHYAQSWDGEFTGSTDSAQSSSGCIDLSLYVCGWDGGGGMEGTVMQTATEKDSVSSTGSTVVSGLGGK